MDLLSSLNPSVQTDKPTRQRRWRHLILIVFGPSNVADITQSATPHVWNALSLSEDTTCLHLNVTARTYSERGTSILEPRRGQLHAEPHVRPISCHVASLSWQEPEEELYNLLLMKVSGRDRNVKAKMLVVCEVIVLLGDRLYSGSPYAVRPFVCLSD